MSDKTFFLNPHCRRCREPLPRLPGEELHRKMTKQYIPPQPVESWDLSNPRYEGWWLEFIFHGRREATLVIRCAVRLGATPDHPKEDRSPAVVTAVERPPGWEGSKMDCILGVRPNPPSRVITNLVTEPGFEPNMIRVGSFLVFGDRNGRAGAEIQLPIAHLTTWFDNPQIEKW